MEDFPNKACLVAGGHIIHTPDVTYSSVITRKTVHIALTMEVLHDLEVKAADVLNVYNIAPNQEKIRTVLGPEFRNNAGKSAIIARTLYGLKSAGVSFRAHIAQCMQELGCQSYDADPDLR